MTDHQVRIRRPDQCKKVTSDFHSGMRNTELGLFGLWETWTISYEVTEDPKRDNLTVKEVWSRSNQPEMTIGALKRMIYSRVKKDHQKETLRDIRHILETGSSIYDS